VNGQQRRGGEGGDSKSVRARSEEPPLPVLNLVSALVDHGLDGECHAGLHDPDGQGRTLVYVSAQRKRFLRDRGCM